MKVCSVSVDLDPISCYYGIHGLGEPPAPLAHVVLQRALPRFAEIFQRRGIHATFFVVGSDLASDPSGRATLTDLAKSGHELGNHTHHHRYDFARLSAEEIEREVADAHQVIAQAQGSPPIGFRAPGYDMSARVLRVLESQGYQYDSSLFSSWPYYFAKAGVMGVMSLLGRRSHSVLGDPRALTAPVDPYRPGSGPFRRGQSSLVELPIAVSPFLRLPVIGNWLLVAPARVRTRLLESVRSRSFFNLELHGADLLDADQDGIPTQLISKQHDLRIPLKDKQRAFEAMLDRIAQDYRFAPLREVATDVQREGKLRAGGQNL